MQDYRQKPLLSFQQKLFLSNYQLDEYVRQRETAEKAVASGAKDGEKSISNMIDKEYRDEKAVKVAINHIRSGDFVLAHASDDEEEQSVVAE